MSRSGSTGTDGAADLRRAVAGAPFVFVVGKGGTGKTTAAGALALDIAREQPVHLISTDPAHSLGDLFGRSGGGMTVASPCTPDLVLEEFDAAAAAARWQAHAGEDIARILEQGTYLDAGDVAGFTRLALPGVDEMMAVLRLVELAGAGGRVVVDTAPTGHALRLLDAAATHESLARALRAMADKAAVVASSLAGRSVRLAGESLIGELDATVRTFRERVLGTARFIVATQRDDVVAAETRRLVGALRQRRLHVAALVVRGVGRGGTREDPVPVVGAGDVPVCVDAPEQRQPRGCDALRTWLAALAPCRPAAAVAGDVARDVAGNAARDVAGNVARDVAGNVVRDVAGEVRGDVVRATSLPATRAASGTSASEAPRDGGAAAWFRALPLRALLFAGKGGVGKTTCAAAVAALLAESRDVLLCSADPAGSLDDVFGAPVASDGRAGGRLRVLQVDAEAQLARARAAHRDEVLEALARIGLGEAAALDRRVAEALLELAPPGIDELAALAAMMDAAASHETIVLDAAPTGHFMRLLTIPTLALDWTRQLMRIIVRYGAAGAAGETAETLLRTARELKALQSLLHDAARTGVFVVTLDEPLVTAETTRLVGMLEDAGVAVAARITNRVAGAVSRTGACTVEIAAPLRAVPPVGAAALRKFIETWSISV